MALSVIFLIVTWPSQLGPRSIGEIGFHLPGWLGMLLPAAAFAGGLAVSGVLSAPGVALRGGVLAVATYALMAYASPTAEYHRRIYRVGDVAMEFPYGPFTPGALAMVREAVRVDPPPVYSFRSADPLETPPNWLTYLIHSALAVSGFALLAGLLGLKAGEVTSGLSPPVRSNARWGIGLLTAVAFFLAEAFGGDWVRADPGNSGMVGAWLGLAVPLAELAVLVVLARRRDTLSRGSPSPEAG